MRREVLSALAALSDLEYQRAGWLRGQPPGSRGGDLSLILHTLYDDMEVVLKPRDWLGSVLVDGEEVEALLRLGECLTPVLDRLGDEPDSAYLAAPEWAEVVRLAGLALSAMIRSGAFWDP